jgi:hypothetical protein
MVDIVATENALTCGPDGLLVDRCDILTPTTQAVGDLLIAGPDCTAQVMADPAAGDQIIAALGGQWGQRPLLSADGGNASSIGSDGGIFSPSFGAAAPTFGVQYFSATDTIVAADGPIVVYNGVGGHDLTLPPAVIGLSFDVYHEGIAGPVNILSDAGDSILVEGYVFGQTDFGIPSGVSYRLIAISATEWRAEYMGERYTLGVSQLPTNALPGCKVRLIWAAGGSGAVMGTFETKDYGNTWMHTGGPAAWDADGSTEASLSSVYVNLGANNPEIDVFAPGSFHCIVQAQSSNNTIQGFTFSAIDPPSAAANDLYEALFCSTIANVAGHSRSGRIIVDAAAGIYRMANRVNFGTGSWTDRRIEIIPEYIES